MMLKLIALFPATMLAGCAMDPMTAEQQAIVNQMAATNAQSAQTFNMAMGMVNQTQLGNLNTTDYKPIQRSDGVWVYCVRTSSYTVNCRTN